MEDMIKGFILLSIFAAAHDMTAWMMNKAARAKPMSYGAYTRMLTK